MNISLPAASFGLLALVNLIALVWNAAKVSSAVDRLAQWANKADGKIDDHESRISRLEGANE